MARKCLIIRQQKRLNLVNKFVDERIILKHFMNFELLKLYECLKIEKEQKSDFFDTYLSLLVLIIHQKTLLNKHPKNSMFVRLKNRCFITGRSRGFIKKWGISRIFFRKLVTKGLLPGIIKSSW
uniref:ribosomal protein S14 n=1 Tax=Prototheca cerasi TaxID=2509258 RepID=UPI003001575D